MAHFSSRLDVSSERCCMSKGRGSVYDLVFGICFHFCRSISSQRGHQNSLERLPIFFVLMVLGGLKHPLICSALGLVYTVGRFFYFTGYSSGDPKGRLPIGPRRWCNTGHCK
ncbi:hypothetical protein L6452_31007 [Arctium lappa]|uniref:Uncharacterized protein n=1 Tax=Arctium lappa TaxID=4217 RepID=A0ACB8ZIV2_ARCLA|nr:hypothetical protein L6452_31007 [Arctium lappa]